MSTVLIGMGASRTSTGTAICRSPIDIRIFRTFIIDIRMGDEVAASKGIRGGVSKLFTRVRS